MDIIGIKNPYGIIQEAGRKKGKSFRKKRKSFRKKHNRKTRKTRK